jgi:hypothetical protein
MSNLLYLYGIPQGSVLELLFFVHTTPLTTVIPSASANYHLYAHSTQLFSSFSAADTAHIISDLDHTINYVYCWLSPNFLYFPLRRSFFTSVALKTLSPVHSVPNSVVICDSNLLYLNNALIRIVTSDAFQIQLIILQPFGLHHNCISISLLSQLDYYNSLLQNLPPTQTKRLQLVLNAAARGFTKIPECHHISPILKSLHWLKISEKIHNTVLSHTHKTLLSGRP